MVKIQGTDDEPILRFCSCGAWVQQGRGQLVLEGVFESGGSGSFSGRPVEAVCTDCMDAASR